MLLVSAPILGLPEKVALSKVIDSGWLTMGERVRAFEEAFAHAHGAEDCVECQVAADGRLRGG